MLFNWIIALHKRLWKPLIEPPTIKQKKIIFLLDSLIQIIFNSILKLFDITYGEYKRTYQICYDDDDDDGADWLMTNSTTKNVA